MSEHPTPASVLARRAYAALEPYHVLSYFNPHLQAAKDRIGLSELGLYFGGRAAPLGRCPAAVVTATFYNFSPGYVSFGWNQALSAGLPVVEQARTEALDASLRDALGPLVDAPELATITSALRVGIVEAPYAGRPLAAAWAAAAWPVEPHLALWHALAIAREHRGDGHVAALVLAGLSPVEALVLHEAPHPDPTLRRQTLGKQRLLRSRGWSEDDWAQSVASLQERRLLDESGSMSADGAALYDRMEAQTDAAAATFWAHVPEAEAILQAARPFVKAVIDVGYLPGTRRKD